MKQTFLLILIIAPQAAVWSECVGFYADGKMIRGDVNNDGLVNISPSARNTPR